MEILYIKHIIKYGANQLVFAGTDIMNILRTLGQKFKIQKSMEYFFFSYSRTIIEMVWAYKRWNFKQCCPNRRQQMIFATSVQSSSSFRASIKTILIFFNLSTALLFICRGLNFTSSLESNHFVKNSVRFREYGMMLSR